MAEDDIEREELKTEPIEEGTLEEEESTAPSKRKFVWLVRGLTVILAVVVLVLTYNAGLTKGKRAADEASTASVSADGWEGELRTFSAQTGLLPGLDYQPREQAEEAEQILESLKEVTKDQQALGEDSAPVTVTLVEDLSNPDCAKSYHETWPTIEQYVNDGKLRVKLHNAAMLSDYGSEWAAKGAVAAGTQGKLWEFLAAAFDGSNDQDPVTYDEASVKALAEKISIPNLDQFSTDLNSEATNNAVSEQTQAIQQIGVSQTPFIIINTSVIPGAYLLEYVKNTLDYQVSISS